MESTVLLVVLLASICGVCNSQSLCTPGLLRLVGGSTQYEGLVQVCVNFQWGAVCDDFWDTTDASVVCRQLGYSATGAQALVHGLSFAPIFMDNVACNGDEARLVDCVHTSLHDCSIFEHAGVRCLPAPVCVSGAVRLQGGGDGGSGRVEVCSNNAWGTVCDDGWGSSDATVVCRQLGYSIHGAVPLSQAAFGAGSGLIVMDDVACSGTEQRLIDCAHTEHHNCQHFEDASVRCNTTLRCQHGAVRLVNGAFPYEGRVEICFNETWGTVCDDLWSATDAAVVCRQLGFSSQGATVVTFGFGVGPIHLDNVQCVGTETTLSSCPYDSHTADCSHFEDTGVRCNSNQCSEQGAVRLESGGVSSGRVEVCLMGSWGTVCDDLWDNRDAGVVCSQLGYSRHNAVAHALAAFGEGTGPIHLDDVGCLGNEYSLLDCSHSTIDNCQHFEDAGATCNTTLLCENGDIRLNGSSSGRAYHEGRVEVCWNETWGTVCDSGWSLNDATVACRQLGFSSIGATVFYNAHYGEAPSSTPIFLQQLVCSGFEARLTDCSHSGVGQISSICGHDDDAGVRCRTLVCQPGELRLVGGVSPYEGRVEVCDNSEWGTVCDDGWGTSDATVVCRQLGYSHASFTATSYSSAHFGQGVGTIRMDDVSCSGSEARLLDCPHVGSDNENCGHFEDAGVRCSQCAENSVRLRGGSVPNEGRVEVCLGGGWGTVCDDGWSTFDAIVVCRQLGFSPQGASPVYSAGFGQGTNLTIAMDAVGCTSSETHLSACSYRDANNIRSCSHSEDAGVICTAPPLGPPASLQVSNTQPTSFTLGWSLPPPADRSEVITGFSVNCTNSNGYAPWSQTVSGNSTLSVGVSGVEEYTVYMCCVAANGGSGRRGGARCINHTTSAAAPSGPPTQFSGHATSSRSLYLDWSPPALRDRNGVISGYRVVCNGSVPAVQVSQSTHTLTGLTPYFTYNCTVAAVTSQGVGPASGALVITTFQDVPSGPPSSVTITTLTATSASLSIAQPSLQDRNGVILSYSIWLTKLSNNQQHTFETTNSVFTFPSLTPYTLYMYRVAAGTVNGTGPYSQAYTFTTNETAPSSAPRSINIFILDATSVSISWDTVDTGHRNGVVRHYSVRVTHADTGLQRLQNDSSSPLTVSSLHPYYYYDIDVAAFTVALGPYSDTVQIRMPEDVPSAAPSGIIVIGASPTSFYMSWNPLPIAAHNGIITGYTLRLTYPGGAQVTRDTTDTHTTFESLLASTTYSVSVAARTAVGRGPYSGERTFTTSVTAPTSAPSQVTLSATSSTSLSVSWTSPATAEWNGERRGFKITLVEVESGQNRNFTVDNSATSTFLISSLHPYYRYRCRVAAYNSAGTGPYSATVTIRLPQDVPSAVPADITGVIHSSRHFTMSWSPPPAELRNGIITHYNIRVTTATLGTTFINTTQTSLDFPSASFSLVVPATVYIVQLAAWTIAGQGPYTTDYVVQTPEDRPTHFPENLTEEILNSTSFRLRWDPPPPEHHNGEIREYRVNVTELETGQVYTFTTPVTELLVSGLHPYYLYECAVSAVTVDVGPFSAVIAVRTHEAAPSAAPRNLSTTFVSSTSVSLNWLAPEESGQNGIIRRYTVFFTDLTTNTETTVDTIGSSGSITLSNLEPFRTYSVRVGAYTVSLGPLSAPLQFTTLQDVPGTPQGFALVASSATTLQASWMQPEADSLNGVLVSYQLVLRELPSGQQTQYSVTATTTTFVWSDLHPHYSYSVSIAAATAVGNGPSLESQIQMPEAAPISSPLDIAVTNNSPTSVSVSWTPPLFENRNGVIRRYRLQLMEVETGSGWTRNTTATHFLFDFLQESFQYTLRIAADTVAVGPYSNPLQFSTLPDIPSEGPLNLVVTAVDPFTVSASWSPPSLLHRNGEILRYFINITRTNGEGTFTYRTPNTSHVSDMTLHPDYSYHYSVAAENSVGRGPSTTSIFHTPEASPSGPPLNFTASPLNSRTLELSWLSPAAEQLNGLIRQYHITVHSQTENSRLNFTTTENRLTVTDLRPFYTYTCTVAAFTVGLGPNAMTSIQLPQDAPEVAPANFTATYSVARPTSITLQWTAIPLEHRNGILTGYIVTIVVSEGNNQQPREITLEPNLVMFEVMGLRPNTEYNVTIAAVTVVARGPASSARVTLLPRVPNSPPALGEIIRLSATEIQINWSGDVAAGVEVDTYFIKYRPLLSTRVRRNTDDLVTIIETNQTGYLLTGLEPRLSYAVSVAARNRAGVGNFSDEVTVGLFDSSVFVVHLTGAIVCVPWLTHDPDVKLSLILNTLVTRLTDSCSCRLSVKYVAEGNLSCGDRTTDRVILHGALIGTEGSGSSDLHAQLQSWVDASPTVEVRGIPLTIVACSTYPGGEASCEIDSGSFSPTNPVVVATEEKSTSGLGGVPLYAAVAGGVAFLLMFVLVIVVLVGCIRRKQRRKRYKMNRMNLNMGNTSTTTNPLSISPNIKESELDDVKFDFEDSEHIYDDPNLFTSINGQGPRPSSNPAVEKLRALDYTTPAPKLQPSTAAAAKGQGNETAANKDPRYTNLPGYATPRPSQSTAPPPPGYAKPKSSGLATAPVPPNTSVQKRPDYAVPGPQVTPVPAPNPPSSTVPKPPGYAVPRPQSTGDKQQASQTLAKPEGNETLVIQEEKETLATPAQKDAAPERRETVGYFSLLQVTQSNESGAYQELSSVQTELEGDTQKRDSALVEDDQYVVMKSAKTHN